MGKKQDNKMSIIPKKEEFKKEARMYVLVLLFSSISLFGGRFWDTLSAGAETQKKADFITMVNDSAVVYSIFNNKHTIRQVALIKKQGQEEIMKRESSKVGLRDLISETTKLAVQFIDDVLSDIINAWNKGEFINKDDCKENIKDAQISRGRHNLTRN